MSKFLNLHEESIYLQGARDVLLRIEQSGGCISYNQGKSDKVYSKAVFNEILHNRESLVKFLQGIGWQYYDHQKDKKGHLKDVKVRFVS